MDLLDYIIKYMNNKVQVASNIFDNIYGLCELNGTGNDRAYMHYVGGGEGKPVTDFDKANGTLFWVKGGSVSITPDAPVQLQDASCSAYVTINYPLRAVCVVKKKHLPCDNATAVDQIAQEMLHKLGGKDKTLRAALSASYCTINPSGYTQDVKGLPVAYEYACFALDYTIQVVLKQSCIPSLCEEVPVPSCDFSVQLRNTEGLIVYTVNQGSANPFTLAAQEVVDGNGNTIEVPYDPNTPFVTTACTITCDAATVNVNGNLFNTVASGGTLNVPVQYENGTPVGTINAGVVEVPNPVTCADATAVLKNTDGTNISSTNIASGASADIIAPDGTAVLKDTAGTTISTTGIASNTSENIVAPDGHVHIKKEGDGTIANVFPKSGETVTYDVADSVITLQDTDGNSISVTNVHATDAATIVAPDGSITVNSVAFDTVLSDGTTDVVVKDTGGNVVGSKVGSEWIVPELIQDVFINVKFDTGATLDYTITIDSDSAGTYTSASFSGGMASATYEVNGSADTLPFTLVSTDTLRIVPDAEGNIKLNGTF